MYNLRRRPAARKQSSEKLADLLAEREKLQRQLSATSSKMMRQILELRLTATEHRIISAEAALALATRVGT